MEEEKKPGVNPTLRPSASPSVFPDFVLDFLFIWVLPCIVFLPFVVSKYEFMYSYILF